MSAIIAVVIVGLGMLLILRWLYSLRANDGS